MSLDKLEKEKKNLLELHSKEFENLPDGMSWYEVEEHFAPINAKIEKVDQQIRMVREPEFSEITSRAHIMSLEDFIENVKVGNFIDYDGSGNYVRGNKESDISIYPSDVKANMIRKDFDKVAWYNK